MMSDQRYEPFVRAALDHVRAGLDLSYEDTAAALREANERHDRFRLLERWNAPTPDGRTVGEVLQAKAKRTRDADLPAVGSFG